MPCCKGFAVVERQRESSVYANESFSENGEMFCRFKLAIHEAGVFTETTHFRKLFLGWESLKIPP